MKIITIYTVIDRLKINGSVARRAIRELEEAGTIKRISTHGTPIYVRA